MTIGAERLDPTAGSWSAKERLDGDVRVQLQEARTLEAHLRSVALEARLERAQEVISAARALCAKISGPETLELREALARAGAA